MKSKEWTEYHDKCVCGWFCRESEKNVICFVNKAKQQQLEPNSLNENALE